MVLFKLCIVWGCCMCVSMRVCMHELYRCTSICSLQPLYRCTHHSCKKYNSHSRISRTDLLLVSSHRTIVREAAKLTGDELWVLCQPKKWSLIGEEGRRWPNKIKFGWRMCHSWFWKWLCVVFFKDALCDAYFYKFLWEWFLGRHCRELK